MTWKPSSCEADGTGEWPAKTQVSLCSGSVHTAIQGAQTDAHSVLLYWDSKGSLFLKSSFLGSLHSYEIRVSKGTQILNYLGKILPKMISYCT